MNFLTRLVVAALALAFMAIAPARAQTVPYGNLSQSTWVSIGTGPLAVTLNTTAGIYWLSASSQPSASVIGNPIDLSQPVPQPVVIPGPGTIWVRAIQSGGASIQVTPAQGGASAPLSVAGNTTTTTATVVPLSAATSAQLVAANPTRKGLRWMVVGANPATIVPGASAAVVGYGMNYTGASGTGQQGGSEAFEGTAVPGDAFQAISTLGTTIIVWEQN